MNFPADLVAENRWIAWRYETRDGKQTKVPISPATGGFVNATDPANGLSFAKASDFVASNPGHGLGFILGDGYHGIDLDKCLGQDGALPPAPSWIINTVNSYTEVSPSGKGIHIIARVDGEIPNPPKNRNGHFEYYPGRRFFCMTGAVYTGKETLREATQEVRQVLEWYRGAQDATPPPPPPAAQPAVALPVSDDHVVVAASFADRVGGLFATDPAAREQARIRFLRDYGDDDSRADAALAGILAQFTSDADQIERIMRTSCLVREKWDGHPSYMSRTIGGVIEKIRTSKPALANRIAAAGSPPSSGYTVWTPSQFLNWRKPVGHDLMFDANGETFLARSEIMAIVGQAEAGKSLLAFNIALLQIQGVPLGPIHFTKEPMKWLFIGVENGIARVKRQLEGLMNSLPEDEKIRASVLACLDSRLHLHALQEDHDGDISLAQEENVLRLAATIRRVGGPLMIVIDPLVATLAGEGELNSWRDMLETIARIRQATTLGGVVEAGIMVVHHAKTGKVNLSAAFDLDRGSFGIGSKGLHSRCRFVLNVANYDGEDNLKIAVVCGKTNNAPRFPSFGLVRDPKTLLYQIDPTYEEQAVRDNLAGTVPGQEQEISIEDVLIEIGRRADAGEPRTPKDVSKALAGDYGVSTKTVLRRLQAAKVGKFVTVSKTGECWLTKTGEAAAHKAAEKQQDAQ